MEQEARKKRAFPMHLMSAPYWLPSRLEQNVTAVYVGQPSGNLKIKRPCLGDHWRKDHCTTCWWLQLLAQLYGLPREEDSERLKHRALQGGDLQARGEITPFLGVQHCS